MSNTTEITWKFDLGQLVTCRNDLAEFALTVRMYGNDTPKGVVRALTVQERQSIECPGGIQRFYRVIGWDHSKPSQLVIEHDLVDYDEASTMLVKLVLDRRVTDLKDEFRAYAGEERLQSELDEVAADDGKGQR